MSKFEKGDVVILNSGSHKMTVNGYEWDARTDQHDDSAIVCVWFAEKETKYGTFPEETLRKLDNDN